MILLPNLPNTEQMVTFIRQITYKYCKAHSNAATIQTIMFQILQRLIHNHTVQILHVYSHLIDHLMNENVRQAFDDATLRWKNAKMQELYGEQALLFLKGNYWVDQQFTTIQPQNSPN